MSYRFYTKSTSVWSGMYQAISQAQESVFLEMYIFLEDTRETHDFVGLLVAKAEAGVLVALVLDAFGSHNLSKKAIKRLRTAGVDLHFFSHLLYRSHRKILVIDKKLAFIGGANIKKNTQQWNDLTMQVSGVVVKPILKSFAYTYKISGGKNPQILVYSEQALSRKIKAWLVDNWPRSRKTYYLDNYYREKIANAQKSVKMTSPYLAPPRWLMALIDSALRRGVRVEILIPKNTDHRSLNKVNYLNAGRLSALGARCYFLPVMNHSKIMIIDDEEAVVGSQNLDIFSFGINFEAGIFFSQKEAVRNLLRIFDNWKKTSTPFNYKKKKKINCSDRFLLTVIKFLEPLF